MKKIFTFLMTMMLATVSIMAKTGSKPAGSSDAGSVAVPAFSEFVADGETIFYLYNVEAHAFVTGGNDWGTRASGNIEKGNQFKFTDNGGKYKMADLVGDNWNALDCDGNKDSWVDGQGRAGDGTWVIAPLGNNTYSISNTVAGDLKWGIQLDMANSRVQFKSNAAYGYTWAFVSAADYDAYIADLDKDAVNALLAENVAIVNEVLAEEIKAANKAAIDAMGAIVNGTNIYGEGFDAYAAKYNDYLAQLEAGTLNETVVNPSAATGWHSSTAFNFLLTPWISNDKACNNFDNNLYINTWSTEGVGDGSNFLVPFFEYWTGDDASLGANTIKTTVTGLVPGQEYTVSALVRVRIKNNGGTDASGITFQAGEGEAVNVCDGDAYGVMRVKQVTATGVADANGELVIAFNVADNNVSWLSFKNVSYETTQPVDLTISPAFIVEGEEEIVTLNDHSSVSVPSANALKVNFGDNAAVKYATYVINELVEEEFMGQVDTFEDEVATGTLSINTIGYAEFEEPLTFYYGHKYNILIKAWDVDENNLFDENFIMASPIATFTAEFNGSTDETPAGEDIVVTPSFVLDGEEIALNDHSAVSVEAANAIKVAIENAQPTEINYVINEMVQSESEEGTSWTVGQEIASGALSINGIAYAEFANTLTFVSGKKYQLTVSVLSQSQELGSYTYEFNGAYVAPEMAEIADGVYRIFNMEAEKFLSNGAYWGTRAVLSDNGISYNVVRNLENGKYTLKSGIKGDAKALRPTDGFNDQSGEWEIYKYDNNGGVVLFNGEKYFSYDGTTNIPQFVDEPTDASVWQFVSEQALKDMIATATPDLPMDATIYVKGADFLNGDVANAAWAGNKVGGDNGQGNTKINNTNCEAWNKGSFTISQTITDLPNGFYSLTAFGYYREGNRDVASSVDAYENGTENASILSANDKSVALKSVYSEAKTAAEGGWAVESAASSEGNVYFIPNSQAEAAACFEAGAYVNEIKNIEVTDGTLTISVSREGEAIFDWTVFDNVRLTYYGAAVAPVAEDCDLTKEMFFQYNSNTTGEALEEPATIGCDYNVGVSNGMIYGLSTVKWYAYADVTDYSKLILAVTEGTPRIMYNREMIEGNYDADGQNHVEITAESPYLTVEEIGDTKYYVYDLKAMAAADPAKPFVHINAIKGANWANATINEMKLFGTAESAEEYLKSLVVLEPEIATALINGEEEIALNSHSIISVEKINAIQVDFIDMPNVASATYAIMPMTLVQTEEGSNWTPNADEATSGEFSINNRGYAEVDYIFEQGTKYQIVVKATLVDGSDVTETYEINGATEPVEPEIAVADMKFNVAEEADLDEDGDFKVEFTFAATANEVAAAQFPQGFVSYKVIDAEENVVEEGEVDFDLALTTRNIYLKNLEAGNTYTLIATKIYGTGFDMETFESVEIPATITGELPTITFFVPEAEEEKAIETVLIYGEEEITLNSHTNISADQIQAIKVNFIGMPNVTSASYSIAPMTKVESAEGTSWTPNADEATTGELSINTIGYAEVDYKFEQGTKYQITVKATLQDGTEVTETYEINGSTATYSGYIASTGMLLSTGVSKSFEQPETISVNSKEISFENVFIPVVNIATGDFTIPVTTETDATGNTIYRAQEVDVDLHDVYYSGGQDDAVPFKAWLIGIESTDGPILFVHLQSNLQDIFIAYNALLKDAIWMMSEITPEDVNAGGAKVLNFLEATSINSVATDAKANGKYLENGKVIIVNKDKKYNVNGAIIK